MVFSVAAVSFLNTIPLVAQFTDLGDPRIALTLDLPSRVADKLTSGQADAGLVPTVEVLRGRTGGILSPAGIACDGPVDSVALFAAGPLPGLQRVLVDRGSRTSIALLRLLLAELHGSRPVFIVKEPVPGLRLEPGEGILVIGDRCFAQYAALRAGNPDGITAHDLGDLWKRMTGLPFIFAAWACSSRLVAEATPQEIRDLGDLLTTARDYGLARLEELAIREAAAGKLGRAGEASAAAIDYYFRKSLRFILGEREMAGLHRFKELCVVHGLAPDNPNPELLYLRR